MKFKLKDAYLMKNFNLTICKLDSFLQTLIAAEKVFKS